MEAFMRRDEGCEARISSWVIFNCEMLGLHGTDRGKGGDEKYFALHRSPNGFFCGYVSGGF